MIYVTLTILIITTGIALSQYELIHQRKKRRATLKKRTRR